MIRAARAASILHHLRKPGQTSTEACPTPGDLAGGEYALTMPFDIGIWELLILLLVVLLVFGPKRLPEMGRQLGKGMREFKESVAGRDDEPVDAAAELPRSESRSSSS